MHVNATMVEQERLHQRRLVAADVVADDVDLAAAGLAGDDVLEEGDELLAGMAGSGLAEHFAGAGIERGEQAQRAVALVFEAMALGASGRQRQHPVLAVERLDRRLLVHAEHGRVRRRVQVEADHVGRLGLEVRVVGDHVGIEPVRAHAVLAPNALDGRERHVTEFSRQLAAAPVRRAIRGLVLERAAQHPSLQPGDRRPRRAPRMQRDQSGESLRLERRCPPGDELVVAGKLASNVDSTLSVAPKQHAPRSARQGSTAMTPAHHGVQFSALFACQLDSLHASLLEGHASDLKDSILRRSGP